MDGIVKPLADGSAIVQWGRNASSRPDEAFLYKTIKCRRRGCCGTMRMLRFTPLHPTGIRGYYACDKHLVALKRDRVTRLKEVWSDRIWFST